MPDILMALLVFALFYVPLARAREFEPAQFVDLSLLRQSEKDGFLAETANVIPSSSPLLLQFNLKVEVRR